MNKSKSQPKRHGFLSANSLFLRQDDAYSRTVSTKNVAILLTVVLVTVGLLAVGWMLVRKHTAPKLASATVKAKDFSYSLQFYPGASIQTSRGTNYLVKTNEGGKEVTIWVTHIEKVLSCGHNPTFSYRPESDVSLHSSCYKPDRTVFVADIVKDKKVYQINMTSKAPISVTDAQEIFKTVTIH
jgi:hypothetical protein